MITSYQTGDAQLVISQKAQREEAAEFAPFFDDIPAYSLIDDESGAVLAVFGYRLVTEDTAECFALMSEMCMLRLREMVMFLKQKISEEMRDLFLRRVIMTVKKNFAAGMKFAKILGFHLVAELPDFYLGQDYQLFERSE